MSPRILWYDTLVYDFGDTDGLHSMCSYAAEHTKGRTVKFEVFNREERDRVHEIMKRYPQIDFFCTWIDFKDR